jgi:hypothetical protein
VIWDLYDEAVAVRLAGVGPTRLAAAAGLGEGGAGDLKAALEAAASAVRAHDGRRADVV